MSWRLLAAFMLVNRSSGSITRRFERVGLSFGDRYLAIADSLARLQNVHLRRDG